RRRVAVDRPQRRDVDLAPGAARRARVGGELLAAGDRGRDAQEGLAVPQERQADEPVLPGTADHRLRQALERAPDRLPRAVDPRAEPRVAAGVVAELVRDDAAQP